MDLDEDDTETRIRKADMVADTELYLLQRKLDDHIHVFEDHVERQDRRWDQLIETHHETNEHIRDLVSITTDLHASSRDVIAAWETGQSVVRAGSLLGRFVKWLTGLAAIGVIIAWLVERLPSGLSGP